MLLIMFVILIVLIFVPCLIHWVLKVFKNSIQAMFVEDKKGGDVGIQEIPELRP